MEISLLLIIIGVLIALTVHYALGLACIVIGLILLAWGHSGVRRR